MTRCKLICTPQELKNMTKDGWFALMTLAMLIKFWYFDHQFIDIFLLFDICFKGSTESNWPTNVLDLGN